MTFIKRYYPELMSFGLVLFILLVCLNPDYTFINKGADSIGYAYSAKYLYPSFHTSPPLYLLVSHLFLQLPFGSDALNMGLFSLISTMVACLFIYLTIRKLTADSPEIKSRFYALIGVIVYGTSALVISQSTIIQTYAITCMLVSGAYYFGITKHWKLMGLFIGMSLAVHLIAFFMAFILFFAFKEYRKNWKALAITASFLLLYAYIPITNRPPYMWMPDPVSVSGDFPPFLVNIYSFVVDTLSTIGFLIGKISIWDFPKRVLDTTGIMFISLAGMAFIPVIYYFWKTQWYRKSLFWLIATPILIFLVELDMNTFDYTMISMPFLAITVGLGLQKFALMKHKLETTVYLNVTLAVLAFASLNTYYFDIGKNLDPELGASKLYYEEMAKIPDGAIFMPNNTWEWEAIFMHNKEYSNQLYPVGIDILPSHQYTDQLQKDGVKLVRGDSENLSIQARQTAMSIIQLNDNVWTTIVTDPRTFSVVAVPCNHDTSLVDTIDEDYIKQKAENPKWDFMPYNPYDIITTSIMMEKWNYVLLSNQNIAKFSFLIVLGWGGFYLVYNSVKNKRKKT